jgi:hypothetical protein
MISLCVSPGDLRLTRNGARTGTVRGPKSVRKGRRRVEESESRRTIWNRQRRLIQALSGQQGGEDSDGGRPPIMESYHSLQLREILWIGSICVLPYARGSELSRSLAAHHGRYALENHVAGEGLLDKLRPLLEGLLAEERILRIAGDVDHLQRVL